MRRPKTGYMLEIVALILFNYIGRFSCGKRESRFALVLSQDNTSV